MFNDIQRANFVCWLNTSSLPFPESVRMWMLNRIVGSTFTQFRMKAINSEMMLDLADSAQSHMFLDKQWEPDFSNWASFFSAHSKIIFDIGGHVGYFTLLMSNFAPNDVVLHTFEPNPYVFEILKHNIELNKSPVVLNPIAVTALEENVQFSLPHRLRLGTGRFGHLLYSTEQITVKTISLDHYCEHENIDRVDLIKMDIEGGEAKAIAGMKVGLQIGRYKVIIMEFHQTILLPKEIQDILETLKNAGYHIYEVHNKRLLEAESISTSCFCALSPEMYQKLGAPKYEFILPSSAHLPYPI